MINRILTVILAGLVTLSASARDFVSDFAAKAHQHGFSFSYSGYVTDGEVPVELNGEAQLKGDTYRMEGNGLVVWCDGKERISIDIVAKEVVLERTILGDATSIPMHLLSNLQDYFEWDSKGYEASFSSTFITDASKPLKTLAFSLRPLQNTNVRSLVLYFDYSGNIKGADMTIDGNVRCIFGFENVRFSESSQTPVLSRPEFDQSYIVTDLR